MGATDVDKLDEFLDDTVLTKEQSEFLLKQIEEKLSEANTHRHKRKIFNFVNFPTSKWESSGATTVIPYKYDGTHGELSWPVCEWDFKPHLLFKAFAGQHLIDLEIII